MLPWIFHFSRKSIEAPILAVNGVGARLNMQKFVPETVEMYGVES